MFPKVSIIIPFYQRVDWLMDSLDSVFSQTYPKNCMEVIVINDGSTESIDPVVKKYGESATFLSQENKGAASARNRGIEYATGDYIAFLDSDDIWTKNKLAVQVDAMERSNALWSYMSYETFGKGRKYVRVGGKISNHFPQILYSSNIATPTIMIRRDIFSQKIIQKFDCSLRCGEDLDLWIRLARIEEILAIPDIGAKVRIRNGSTMHSIVQQLHVRALLADRIQIFEDYQGIPFLCRAGYKCSKKAYQIFTQFESLLGDTKVTTLIAGILYIIPYILFKLGLLLTCTETRNGYDRAL